MAGTQQSERTVCTTPKKGILKQNNDMQVSDEHPATEREYEGLRRTTVWRNASSRAIVG